MITFVSIRCLKMANLVCVEYFLLFPETQGLIIYMKGSFFYWVGVNIVSLRTRYFPILIINVFKSVSTFPRQNTRKVRTKIYTRSHNRILKKDAVYFAESLIFTFKATLGYNPEPRHGRCPCNFIMSTFIQHDFHFKSF